MHLSLTQLFKFKNVKNQSPKKAKLFGNLKIFNFQVFLSMLGNATHLPTYKGCDFIITCPIKRKKLIKIIKKEYVWGKNYQ